jgi:hypothetical protein
MEFDPAFRAGRLKRRNGKLVRQVQILRKSNAIFVHGWDSNMYCTVPEWVDSIPIVCACGNDIDVQGIDEGEDYEYVKMHSQGIWSAQEAMKEGIFVRKNGDPSFIAQRGTRRETAPTTKGFQGDLVSRR